jgi:hypothetical protein
VIPHGFVRLAGGDLAEERAIDAGQHPSVDDDVIDAYISIADGSTGTNAVRSPVRPAMRWMRVVSRASARLIAGRTVVSRRAWITCVSRICSPLVRVWHVCARENASTRWRAKHLPYSLNPVDAAITGALTHGWR